MKDRDGRPRGRGPKSNTRDECEGVELPLVVLPRAAAPLVAQELALRTCIARYLSRVGVIMFRGFSVGDEREFGSLVAALSGSPVPLDEASFGESEPVSWRLRPPARAEDAMCNDGAWLRALRVGRDIARPERWYCRRHPQRVWLYCASGHADVVVADTREVHAGLSEELRERWTRAGLLVSRTYSDSGTSSWQSAFESSDRGYVAAWCDAEGFRCEWLAGGGLKIHKICQAVAQHPRSGDRAWFNAAHACQAPDLRGSGLLPGMEVLFGNGEPLPECDLHSIGAEFDAAQLIVPFEPGDILLLDNLLMAHAVTSARSSGTELFALHGYSKRVEAPARDPVARG